MKLKVGPVDFLVWGSCLVVVAMVLIFFLGGCGSDTRRTIGATTGRLSNCSIRRDWNGLQKLHY